MDDGDDYSLDADWVNGGTESWDDFQCFAFDEGGLEIYFPPYQVGPYASGQHVVQITYEKFGKLVKPLFESALEIEYLQYWQEDDH